MQKELPLGVIDQKNVPLGMVAVLKSEAVFHDNFCNHCDYRSACVEAGGKAIPCSYYRRPDGCSVYFVERLD